MKFSSSALLAAALILTACDGSTTPAAKDTAAPTVSLSRSISDANGIVVLTASASDNTRVSRVEFYQGSTLLATDKAAPFTYETDVTAPRTGFTARAYDAAGNVGTSAAFDIVTPYQGVWGWALGDASGTVIDSGAVIFFDEGSFQGRVAGFGVYQNSPANRTGVSLMGPLFAAGKLEVIFSAGLESSTGNYFYGEDADDTLGTYQGKATVEGAAVIYDSTNTAGATVALAMVQDSAVVPQSLSGQNTARQNAGQRAVAYLTSQRVPVRTLTLDQTTVKSVAAGFLNR
ncbi:hypothetical protein HNQ07_000222 [Deinococcus metalli]|uniref:Uncharacterized protein n=1 Tax=Deinococcus metalli TaxID=1141878 RepID=A0A7W8NPF3_9DEIO|nr:Ig-like domain-containing protein [Deinococcus metalli]MBB5374778.1 hypothetical protein [Deinococcus metalli]GHF33789.1 hypothetical protein GCM10017781_08200 [Deinococcus metalli]